MVSLEKRSEYKKRIAESPKLMAFYNLLQKKTVLSPNEHLNESEETFYSLFKSVQMNDKVNFELYYTKKSKSNPSKESPSPFVNDDFFIFCIIVGVYNFKLDKQWIKNIIAIRIRNAITITFENIINENYYSKSNFSELVFAFLDLTNQNLITIDFLNATYQQITNKKDLFESKNDIEIICAINAYDIVIERKETDNFSEISLLKQFKATFKKRMSLLAYIFQTIVIFFVLYVVLKILSISPNVKQYIDKIGSAWQLITIFGISQIGNILPPIRRLILKIIMLTFGYPKELLEKDKVLEKAKLLEK